MTHCWYAVIRAGLARVLRRLRVNSARARIRQCSAFCSPSHGPIFRRCAHSRPSQLLLAAILIGGEIQRGVRQVHGGQRGDTHRSRVVQTPHVTRAPGTGVGHVPSRAAPLALSRVSRLLRHVSCATWDPSEPSALGFDRPFARLSSSVRPSRLATIGQVGDRGQSAVRSAS